MPKTTIALCKRLQKAYHGQKGVSSNLTSIFNSKATQIELQGRLLAGDSFPRIPGLCKNDNRKTANALRVLRDKPSHQTAAAHLQSGNPVVQPPALLALPVPPGRNLRH